MRGPGQQESSSDNHSHSYSTQTETARQLTIVETNNPQGHSAIAGKPKEQSNWYKEPDWWVAIFTAALFFATAGLWLFTALLWRTTRQALRDGQETAAAARQTAAASKQNVDLARSSLHDLQRAYLFVFEIKEIEIWDILEAPLAVLLTQNPIYPSAQMFLKNYGKTPANIVSMGIFIDVTSGLPEFITSKIIATNPLAARGNPEEVEIVIGDGETYNVGGFKSRTNYTLALIDQINTDARAIYCHGWVNYIDIFMKPHEVVFCRRYLVMGRRFVPIGGRERNHAD
jgi:hypothetical protein